LSIGLHKKDIVLLELIRSYFGGVGTISSQGKDILQYRVASLQDLTNKIIPHFENNPLISQKKADFILFKKVVDLMNLKEHLTTEGLRKIVAIKASMNLGLSEELRTKAAFLGIVPIERPLIQNQKILDPYWLAGFASGEGSFMVTLTKTSSNKLGF
jgi:LAGLIDADG endonuclease